MQNLSINTCKCIYCRALNSNLVDIEWTRKQNVATIQLAICWHNHDARLVYVIQLTILWLVNQSCRRLTVCSRYRCIKEHLWQLIYRGLTALELQLTQDVETSLFQVHRILSVTRNYAGYHTPLPYKHIARCRYRTWYMTNHIATTQNGHCVQIMDVSRFSSACQFLSNLMHPYILIYIHDDHKPQSLYNKCASVSSKSRRYPFLN